MGHLHQERQNLQSTKVTPNKQKTHDTYVALMPFKTTHKAYGDLTGRFPYVSSRGNQYFLVVYDYDSNAILVEVLKSRSGKEIKKRIHDNIPQFRETRLRPKDIHIRQRNFE